MVMRIRMRMGEMREERLRCEKGGGVFSFYSKRTTGEGKAQLDSREEKTTYL